MKLSLVLAGLALVAPATSAKAPALSHLRVCGRNQVLQSECPSDQRNVALVARALECTVRVSVTSPATVAAQLLYNGALQEHLSTAAPPGSHIAFVGIGLSNTRAPAGTYTCRFSIPGHRVSVSFRSGGPTGHILGPAVCLGAHEQNGDCPRDESGAPFSAPSSLTCSAVFVGERGKAATFSIVNAAGHVVRSQHGGQPDRHGRGDLAGGVVTVHARHVPLPLLGRRHGGATLVPGLGLTHEEGRASPALSGSIRRTSP